MKNFRKLLLFAACACVLMGTTACSNKDDTYNGADQTTNDSMADEDQGTDNTADTDTMNDATKGDGVLDDAVDDVTDGVDRVTDDITDGVDKAADDLTEENSNR